MTTHLVTRHEGTRLWMEELAKDGRLPFAIDRWLDHLDLSLLQAGDVVVGTLPLHLAAELHERGIVFWSLDLALPAEYRGKELSVQEMQQFARPFTCYAVQRVQQVAMETPKAAPSPPAAAKPSLGMIVVSAQTPPAAIGWLHQPTEEVWLLATSSVSDQTAQLEHWFAQQPNPPQVVVKGLDEKDHARLLQQAEDWAGQLAAEARPAVVLHLTGGTKLMTLALHQAFERRAEAFGSRLSGLYADTKNKQIIDPIRRDWPVRDMQSALTVRDHLELRGYEVKNAASTQAYYSAWLGRHALFDILLEERNKPLRRVLFDLFHCAQRVKSIAHQDGGRVVSVDRNALHEGSSWSDLEAALGGALGAAMKNDAGIEHCFKGKNRGRLELIFKNRPSEEEARFFTGAWLEYWLATQAMRAGVDDLAISFTIADKVTNEIDLIMSCGNQLLVAEVKSSGGGETSTITEAIYKLDSIAKRFGTDFVTPVLVSLDPIKPEPLKRAEDRRIIVLHGDLKKSVPAALRKWADQNRRDRIPGYQPRPLAP
jgi:CRISPR-associated protein Csx16